MRNQLTRSGRRAEDADGSCFSSLKRSFREDQTKSLEDFKKLSTTRGKFHRSVAEVEFSSLTSTDYGMKTHQARSQQNTKHDKHEATKQVLAQRKQTSRFGGKVSGKIQIAAALIFAFACTFISLNVANCQTLLSNNITTTPPEQADDNWQNKSPESSLNKESTVSLERNVTETASLVDTTFNSSENDTATSISNLNQAQKLKPINFTLVDEIFDSVLSEDEVVKRWKNMDLRLQDGMKSILKMLFPQIVALSQDARVSGDCSGGILKWILSLRNLRSWAIKMLDATGKPTAGIFEGSLTMFGNYKQCLSIRAPDEDEIEITDQFEEYFRGQFCVIHLKPWMPIKQAYYNLNSTIDSLLRKNYKYYEKTLYDELAEIAIAFNFVDIRMDLCVPSTCTTADIQRVAELLSKKVEMKAKVMRCDITPRETKYSWGNIDPTSLSWSLLPIILILISILSTIISLVYNNSNKSNYSLNNINQREERSFRTYLKFLTIDYNLIELLTQPKNHFVISSLGFNDNENPNQNINQPNELKNLDSGESSQHYQLNNRLDKNNNVFALYTSPRQQQQQLKPLPLYGLRNIFVIWFIVVQMTVELKYQYLRESLPLRNMIISYWPFQIIVNSSLLFESLILITAFTYSFTCLQFNLKNLINYIVDKYFRLIFTIITVIALTIITPSLSIESPVWRNFVEQQSIACKANGYLDLFFLQNFISYDKICLPHTWIFCVEFQLIILTIPLILMLKQASISTEIFVNNGCNSGKKSSKDCVAQGKSLIGISLKKLLASKVGIIILLIIAIGGLMNFHTVYVDQLPPSWFYTFPDIAQKNYYFTHYLTKTWTHISVFFIGLLGGYLCRTTLHLRSIKSIKNFNQQLEPQPSPSSSTHVASNQSHLSSNSNIMFIKPNSSIDGGSRSGACDTGFGCLRGRLNRVVNFDSWYIIGALVCMLAIIFSTFNWSTKESPSQLVAGLYDTLSRCVWSIALTSIMIKLCLNTDSSSKCNDLLIRIFNHPTLTFLGRLSFIAYLISPYVNTFILAVEEQSLFPSLFLIFHVIMGNIVIIYIISIMLAIVIEQPTRRLIKCIL